MRNAVDKLYPRKQSAGCKAMVKRSSARQVLYYGWSCKASFAGTMKDLLDARGAPHEIEECLQPRIGKTGDVPKVLASQTSLKFMERLVLWSNLFRSWFEFKLL